MRTRAAELKGLTVERGGVTRKWFDENQSLYLDTAEVIKTNLWEREKGELGADYVFPGWWKTFFLIGTNGAGDYYCLRLKGDRKVWMIGTDCGENPSKMYDSF